MRQLTCFAWQRIFALSFSFRVSLDWSNWLFCRILNFLLWILILCNTFYGFIWVWIWLRLSFILLNLIWLLIGNIFEWTFSALNIIWNCSFIFWDFTFHLLRQILFWETSDMITFFFGSWWPFGAWMRILFLLYFHLKLLQILLLLFFDHLFSFLIFFILLFFHHLFFLSLGLNFHSVCLKLLNPLFTFTMVDLIKIVTDRMTKCWLFIQWRRSAVMIAFGDRFTAVWWVGFAFEILLKLF